MIDRRGFLCAAGATLLGASLPLLARAQDNSNGRLIFGAPAGAIGSKLANGALEILARQSDLNYRLDILAERNTLTASETVKAAPADGTTLLQAPSASMVLFPSTYQSLSYDPMADFVPVAAMGDYSYALTLGPAVPDSVTSLAQYLDWVSDNPDFRDIGFALYGSQSHLMTLILGRSKEVAIRPQGYGSVRSLIRDMKNQTISAGITVCGNAELAGKGIRAIAISSSERLSAWPQVATFAEQDVPDMDITGWFGWFAPASIDPGVWTPLQDKIRTVQQTDEFVSLQKQLLLTPTRLTTDEIRERMKSEMARYQKLVNVYQLQRVT